MKSFRAYIFIELLCKKIDLSEKEFQELLKLIENILRGITQFFRSGNKWIASWESSEMHKDNYSLIAPFISYTNLSARESVPIACYDPAPPFAS